MSKKEYKGTFPEIKLKYINGTIKKFKITSSHDSNDVLREIMDSDTLLLREEFVVIFLNNSNNSIGWHKLSIGGMTGTLVDIRLLMVTALQCGAVSMILAHNHPSGNLKPSKNDIELTDRIKKASSLLDIKVLDHLIITEHNYYSFADDNKL
jgi:DNA repair protein RadC